MSIEKYKTNSTPCAQNDPDLFFPPDGAAGDIQTREAKRVCAKCTVADVCLQIALNDKDTKGIWGGTTERERYKIRRNGLLGYVSLTELYAQLENQEFDEQIA